MNNSPLSPLEQRALWLAYWRSQYGPIGGILENEVEKLHYVDLINTGLIQRVEKAPRLKTSRTGQGKMFVITPRGKLAKNRLAELGYEYPYIADVSRLPTRDLKLYDKRAKLELDTPCVLLIDALEWINHERLSRGYPTLSIGWLRKWVNQPYRAGSSYRYLPAVKVGRNWYIPLAELEKRKRHLYKPATYYSKNSSRRQKTK